MTDVMNVSAEDYARAERFVRPHRFALLPGGVVTPNWLDGGHRFWYRTNPASDAEVVLVDPNAEGSAVRKAVPNPADYTRSARTAHHEVESPDGKWAAFVRGNDVWVREISGEPNQSDPTERLEKRLTFDGAADLAYATSPDSAIPRTLLDRFGMSPRPMLAWAPDSQSILTHLTDQRGVELMHLVSSSPLNGGRPTLRSYPYAMPGDSNIPLGRFVVISLDPATPQVVAEGDPFALPYLSPFFTESVWWHGQGDSIYFIESSRDVRTLELKKLDPTSGRVRTIVHESGHTRVEAAQRLGSPPTVRVLSNGNVLWFSQRDGWGHLYRYDSRGTLLNQVTVGEFLVERILHVDEQQGFIFMSVAGLHAEDPYRQSVCRVNFDGSEFASLIQDDLDHRVLVPPGAAPDYFVDSASTIDTPPVVSVRRFDGSVLAVLEDPGTELLEAAGWGRPERIRVTAADGTTPLFGVMYKPHDFDPTRSYPVIDHPYPGPQYERVLPTFDTGWSGHEAEAMAQLGFVVVALDGRGTPGRDKAFHDTSYGRMADAGSLVDHVAALKQLGRERPWMDLDRIGIFGLSGGGFATVRAMVEYPEVFKVGVAEAGNHDNRIYHAMWSEAYDGPPDPEIYARSANTELPFERLTGKLLLVHGELDDNVTPYHTLRLIQRLIAVDKDFDLLLVPGAEHQLFEFDHYTRRRRWDYFVRHLHGSPPPTGIKLSPIPLTPPMLQSVL